MTDSEFTFEYIESEIGQPLLRERHCHGQYEMIAVAEGDITVILEGQQYRLKENQLIIIPPLYYHSVTTNGEGIYRRITALFAAQAIPQVLRDEFSQGGRTAEADPARIEKLGQLCRKEEAAFYAPLLHSLMIENFYDALKMPRTPVKAENDPFLQQTFRYIDQHLHEKILLEDLAKHTSRSKSSFCHRFEEKMKVSPKQYILQKKLALAAKLIAEGMPHTLAAAQVGYENYSNFYRLYRKHLGTMPVQN